MMVLGPDTCGNDFKSYKPLNGEQLRNNIRNDSRKIRNKKKYFCVTNEREIGEKRGERERSSTSGSRKDIIGALRLFG